MGARKVSGAREVKTGTREAVAILASRYAQLGWGSSTYRLWQLPQARASLYLVPSS
jgi:hypothetical protein